MSSAVRTSTPPPKAKADAPKARIAENEKEKRLQREAELRGGFMRKVYGLLSAQLTFTVAVASLCAFTPFIRRAMMGWAASMPWWIKFVPLSLTFGSLLVLQFGDKYRNHFPTNFYLLFLFTLGISLEVGFICAIYYSAGLGHLILQAAGITTLIFLGLTTYVLYSGKDFSFMRGILSTLLWGLVIVGFVAIWFPSLTEGVLYGAVGAVTFCGYILYDTWRISKKMGYDDYILATIELYLDIVNLFLYILDILSKMQNKTEKKKK